MLLFFRLILSSVLLFCGLSSVAQNLVSNGSFEEFSDCPEGLNNLHLTSGWYQARGSCDYFNSCSASGLGVPMNIIGYQDAVEGQAYAGYGGTDYPELEYREHLITELNEPLEIGTTYYFSMQISPGFGFDDNPSSNKACNGHGAMLSTVFYSSTSDNNPFDAESPVMNEAQILSTEIVSDSTNWTAICGSFEADSAYTFLILGVFLDENNIEAINVTGEGPFEFNGEAYYYVDDVRLSSDSTFVNTTISETSFDSKIQAFPNPSQGILSLRSRNIFHQVSAYSSLGELVMTESFHPVRSKQMDLSFLPEGIYFLHVQFDNETNGMVKVIKSH